MSNITIVNHLFVPLRYLQFLKIIRSTAAAAEKGTFKVWRYGVWTPLQGSTGAISTAQEEAEAANRKAAAIREAEAAIRKALAEGKPLRGNLRGTD